MNGYTLMAESYRKIMSEGKIDRETAEKEIRIFEFLDACEQDDVYRLIDSAAFNDIIGCFVKKAVYDSGIDKKSAQKVINQIPGLFDFMTAKEISEKYK